MGLVWKREREGCLHALLRTAGYSQSKLQTPRLGIIRSIRALLNAQGSWRAGELNPPHALGLVSWPNRTLKVGGEFKRLSLGFAFGSSGRKREISELKKSSGIKFRQPKMTLLFVTVQLRL